MTVKLTHSNFKSEVIIYTNQIMAVMYLPQNQTTAVLGVGGAMVPVVGTVDEVNEVIKQAMRKPKKEKPNGIPGSK